VLPHKLVALAAAISSTQECLHTRGDASSSTITAAAALLPLLPPLLCTQARTVAATAAKETLRRMQHPTAAGLALNAAAAA
jgi:hypothetical protein